MEKGLKEQLVFAIIRFKRADSCLALPAKLQLSEMAVLSKAAKGCLCANDGICVSDIHEAMHISKPAVSQILNNLEKRGLVVRSIDKTDRRKIAVTLTEKGEAELLECLENYGELLDNVMYRFGAENAKILVTQVDRLMDILEQL